MSTQSKYRIRPCYPNYIVEKQRVYEYSEYVTVPTGWRLLDYILEASGFQKTKWVSSIKEEWNSYPYGGASRHHTVESAIEAIKRYLKEDEKRGLAEPAFNAQPILYFSQAEANYGQAVQKLAHAKIDVRALTLWRHKKTNKIVRILSHHLNEKDLVVYVTYREGAIKLGSITRIDDQPVEWSRPVDEFLDGRFEKYQPPAEHPMGEHN